MPDESAAPLVAYVSYCRVLSWRSAGCSKRRRRSQGPGMMYPFVPPGHLSVGQDSVTTALHALQVSSPLLNANHLSTGHHCIPYDGG